MTVIRKCLIAGLLVLSLGCQQSPAGLHTPKGKVVGMVQRDRLTVPQVNYAAEQLRAEVSAENLPKILDRMVTVSLLADEAVRRGMLKDEKVLSGLAWVERMYLASELVSRITESSGPSSAEVLAYFQQHKSDFGTGLKLQVMVLPDSAYAEQTLMELKAGADFVKLARERSMDTSVTSVPGYPTRGVGFSLGWSLADEEKVFSLKPGEISPVLATQMGYQIIKVLERKTLNENPTLNEITQLYISEALKDQRRRLTLDSLLNSLRSRAKIVLKPEEYSR